MTPGPSTSARVVVLPGSSRMQGRTFQPGPSWADGLWGSGSARAPPPRSPVGFSAEIDRVSADDNNASPLSPSPVNMSMYLASLHILAFHSGRIVAGRWRGHSSIADAGCLVGFWARQATGRL